MMLLNPYSFAASDPYWDSVVSLMHFDGADGSNVFTDQTGTSWVGTVNAQLDTDQSVFGGSSLQLDGSSRILMGEPVDWDFGVSEFTIEAFVRMAILPISDWSAIASHWPLDTNGSWRLLVGPTGTVLFSWYMDGFHMVSVDDAMSVDTWYHVAVSRVDNDFKLFVGGILVGTTASATAVGSSSTSVSVGAIAALGVTWYLNGNIDEFRVTKGVGRYSADFTPPSSPFPNS